MFCLRCGKAFWQIEDDQYMCKECEEIVEEIIERQDQENFFDIRSGG